MCKIICALLSLYFLIVEVRRGLSVNLEVNQNALHNSTENKISYRLPESVKPNSYDIELKVSLDESKEKNFTFFGTVNISLNVLDVTKNITLHSKDLTIKDLSVVVVTDSFIQPIGVKYSLHELRGVFNDTDFLFITGKHSEEFQKGQYILSITYEGKLGDSLKGFYRSHYINSEGKKVWLAVTHLQPVHARMVFPCFDEPALKATFFLKITHSNKLKAVSNTKSVDVADNKDGTTTTTFEKTPLMSTYLLALVVSDFKSIQSTANNFTVYVRPTAIESGNLAVRKGEKILQKLEEFTNISYEIDKLDQIAIPQFDSGAMENWGLVVYSEEALLWNEKELFLNKDKVIETIAHEFAHQWFGNLVTPKWWKYVWLSEGLATFLSHYIIDQIEKNVHSTELYLVQITQMTLLFDSKNVTSALNMDVDRPTKVISKFDNISYSKGLAIIRMMQHYLSDDILKRGLQRYLKDFRYKTVDSDDLFNSIQKVLDEEGINICIKEVMNAWVNEKGYPIVTVKRNYNNNTITLKQERFATYNASAEEKDNVWYIPISYTTEKTHDFENTSADILFNKAQDTFSIVGAEKHHWVILNKQFTGFYRVNYDEDNWKLIIKYLNSPDRVKIHAINRAQLINDAQTFVKEGIMKLQTFIQLIDHLKHESDYVVWYSAHSALQYLNSKLIYSEYYPLFKEYAQNAMSSLIKKTGFEAKYNDDHLKNVSRIRLTYMACSFGHADCIMHMQAQLEAWLEKQTIIPMSLKELVVCYGLQNANLSLWKAVLNKSMSNEYASEKDLMITGLGCSNQKPILESFLYDSLANKTGVEVFSAIRSVLFASFIGNSNDFGLDIVLDFVIPNISKLYSDTVEKEYLIGLLTEIGDVIHTKEQLEKFKGLENSNLKVPDDFITNAIKNSEKHYINWLEEHNEVLKSELQLKSSNKIVNNSKL